MPLGRCLIDVAYEYGLVMLHETKKRDGLLNI